MSLVFTGIIAGVGVAGLGLSAYEASQSAGLTGAEESLAGRQAGEQSQYNQMLQGIMANPGAFLNSPVFQALQAQGVGAAQTTAAAQGKAGSGNELSAIENVAQGQAGSELFSQEQILAGLTGLGGNAAAQTYGTASSSQATSASEAGGALNTLGLLSVLAGSGNSNPGLTAGDLATLSANQGAGNTMSWGNYTINTPGQ